MTDRPDSLLGHPPLKSLPASSDPLAEVLRTVRLQGAVFFLMDVAPPWAAAMPDGEVLAPILLPRAEQIVSFHVIARGSCWGGPLTGSPLFLEAGDVIVFPRGDGYFLSLARREPVAPDIEQALGFMKGIKAGRIPPRVQVGGSGTGEMTLACGFLGCDIRPFNPLFATLPSLLHVKGKARASGDRLDHLIELAVAQSPDEAPGAESVRLRLGELMFVEVIRRYLGGLRAEETGWLAGLRDDYVGRAIGMLHDRPSHGWTLDELAGQVGLSRSAFADRFVRFVGDPPMQYLMRWRMQLAARLLADGTDKVGAIALEVGYDSEAAFSRAFKKATGTSPAAWRRARTVATM